MPNLNVAVLAPAGYARDLGKAGTTSDITYYNLKKGDVTVTFLEPTRYPERLASLFFAISPARAAVMVVDGINARFGEQVLMLDCMGIREGYLVLRNYLTPEQLAPLIRGTVVEGYRLREDAPISLREELLTRAAELVEDQTPETGTVPVDHAFPVKGIGTVVLGDVVHGAVRRHDTMRVLPSNRTIQVRSIQRHDDDAPAGYQGDRVGLALKGIEAEDLVRGDVLTTDPDLIQSAHLSGRASIVPYWPAPLKEGMVLTVGHWMQFLPARVISIGVEGDWHRPQLRLELERPLVYPPDARVLLCWLDGGRLRVVGTLILD
ncbi:MAG TPA: EF-Tu/IF-2/RF-3 family GTPase [Methanoregulaceae archaeon]|nr:EF-Tu/IF-2/RF-3 family GTPase [Methanoregulaceae archaeon]HOV67992.1 EF-Tu/IF-2/RF-3 family GTPase [Methanoregulaceae archaeon]HQJ87900.1 EF-Tu/IF-2/RF-3 family GTPase [Methanoregulaceae archaeon]